jgi:hypothetical protein
VTDVVLVEIDFGPEVARAVRTTVTDELRDALAAGGKTVGYEIIEIRWGNATAGQPVLDSRPSMIVIDDARALLFGTLPRSAADAEIASNQGTPVPCTIGDGVWLAIVPDTHRGAESYPIVFRDRDGTPVNPGLPSDWDRTSVGPREDPCPACGANLWDRFTAKWEGAGDLRNTRWGYGIGPGQAFVCRICGYEETIGQSIGRT